MLNLIAFLIIVMILILFQSRSEINRERINTDRWRETAIMLNRQLFRLTDDK
jgi:hypothetical protein